MSVAIAAQQQARTRHPAEIRFDAAAIVALPSPLSIAAYWVCPSATNANSLVVRKTLSIWREIRDNFFATQLFASHQGLAKILNQKRKHSFHFLLCRATTTISFIHLEISYLHVAEHRDLIHKIGVTGGKIEVRIANAEHDATYLLAGVDVVATYRLSGINRVKLENLLHRIFAPAQLDLTIQDRFGRPVKPREWFLVPLSIIDEAVERIRDGSITAMIYDPRSARLVAGAD